MNTSLIKYFKNRLPRFQFFYQTSSLMASALNLMKAGALQKGSKTLLLEERLQSYFNVPHCLTTSSFRMGWYFSLKALGLKEGDEVLLTPITIPETVNAILMLKLKPVFVDMSLDNHSVDIEDLKRSITPKTRVILVTYLSGIVPDMNEIVQIAKEHDLKLVEDFSQNYEAHFENRYLGTWGDIGIGSLSSGKILSSTVGGFILTRSEELARKINEEIHKSVQAPSRRVLFYYLRNCLVVEFATLRPAYIFFTHHYLKLLALKSESGIVDFEHDPDHKHNIFYTSVPKLRTEFPQTFFTWLSDWQSQVALDLLQNMKSNTDKRRMLAKTLQDHLSPEAKKFVPPALADYSRNSYYHYPINCFGKKSEMRRKLFKAGIDSGSYGLNLCTEEEIFSAHSRVLKNAITIKHDTLFIPLNEKYTHEHMKHIAQQLNQLVT